MASLNSLLSGGVKSVQHVDVQPSFGVNSWQALFAITSVNLAKAVIIPRIFAAGTTTFSFWFSAANQVTVQASASGANQGVIRFTVVEYY